MSMVMNGRKIASFFKKSTERPQSGLSRWIAPGWIVTVSIVQTITTMVFVSLFFITHDLRQISTCVLYVKNFGYAQYDLVSLGLLVAGPIYQCILCIEALFQRRASCLYAMLAFELWLAIYSGIQSYQHSAIIEKAAECQYNVNLLNELTPATTTEPMISYSIVGVTCACFVLFIFLAIYFRTSFQQSMDPVHGALASLLKIDFYLVFAYSIQLLPVPMLMTPTDDDDMAAGVVGIAEIVLVFGISCVIFLLAWSMVLVTWNPVSWWRVMLHMAGLAVFCLAGITYLCYRLVRFVLDPRTLVIRYALVLTSVCLIIVLLLTMSIVTTCAVQQWNMRSYPQQQVDAVTQILAEDHKQPQSQKGSSVNVETEDRKGKEQFNGVDKAPLAPGDDNDDDICLFLTPQTSRIKPEL
ncbi:hypothetical protein BCR42DRAFT_475713 [Absidia repens]|uniref:Transmembrane protein n=1 Tax=Absidia repens TaxID=90262 RepID=A0A1X2HKS9_9FUNG|nr:hypothetical protein BCR42DRAFT_475713 [Absidia repens]